MRKLDLLNEIYPLALPDSLVKGCVVYSAADRVIVRTPKRVRINELWVRNIEHSSNSSIQLHVQITIEWV